MVAPCRDNYRGDSIRERRHGNMWMIDEQGCAPQQIAVFSSNAEQSVQYLCAGRHPPLDTTSAQHWPNRGKHRVRHSPTIAFQKLYPRATLFETAFEHVAATFAAHDQHASSCHIGEFGAGQQCLAATSCWRHDDTCDSPLFQLGRRCPSHGRNRNLRGRAENIIQQYPYMMNFKPLAKALNFPYFPLTPTFPWLGLIGGLPYPVKYRIEFETIGAVASIPSARFSVISSDNPLRLKIF